MWFSMPSGCGGITVERQEFVPEITDDRGVAYFRAPNHFATKILALKGFVSVVDLPEGAPADLPKEDPLRDGAIEELTNTVEAQKIEIQNLRADLTVATSRIVAFTTEHTEMTNKLAESALLIDGLREQLEDKGLVETPPTKKSGVK